MLQNTKAIIFDMDGLILDTEPIYRSSMAQAATELSYSFDNNFYNQFIGLSTPACREKLMQIFGDDYPKFQFRRRELWEEHVKEIGVKRKNGLKELLQHLDSKQVLKGIATSSIRKDALLCLGELANQFDVIVTGDEVKNGKPAPDIYLLAASRLGLLSDECLVLEDSEFGAKAALAAGIKVVIVPDLQQPSAELRVQAYRVCSSLHEVRELLLVS